MGAERSWLDQLLDRVLDRQGVVVSKVPAEARGLARGRKGRLLVVGEPSTVRYFRWTGERLVEERSPLGVRNTIQMHVDTFLDLLTQELKPREAVAAGLIQISGDLPESQGKVTYDREEFLQLLDRLAGDLILELKR